MNRKTLTDYCYEMLCKLPDNDIRHEEYLRCYRECLAMTVECGYSEFEFADIWYNALLWYRAAAA